MQQQRLFEGYEVHSQFGRLRSFQIEAEDEESFRIGDTLVIVATVTVEPPGLTFDKEGNLKRTNVLSPHVVRVAAGVMRNELIDFFGLIPSDGHLILPPSPTPSPTPTAAPTAAPIPTAEAHSSGGSTPVERSDVVDELADEDGDEDHDAALARFLAERAQ